MSDRGEHWKILTGSDVTELLDVAVDRNAPGTIYFTHTAVIRASHDGGATWSEVSGGLRRKYTEAIRVDSRTSRVLVAGNEEGIFRSGDDGKSWRLAGAAGYQVLHIEQSPNDPCYWLAATQGGGLFVSTDCGVTFESGGNLAVGQNIVDIAFDPTSPNRIAIAGWGVGVAISEDLAARVGTFSGEAERPASRDTTEIVNWRNEMRSRYLIRLVNEGEPESKLRKQLAHLDPAVL